MKLPVLFVKYLPFNRIFYELFQTIMVRAAFINKNITNYVGHVQYQVVLKNTLHVKLSDCITLHTTLTTGFLHLFCTDYEVKKVFEVDRVIFE